MQSDNRPLFVFPSLIRQLVRFGFAGVCATLTHIGVLSFLAEMSSLPLQLANVIAFLIAFCLSFLLHYHWTFKIGGYRESPKQQLSRCLRFSGVALVGYVSNALLLGLCVEVFSLDYYYAYPFFMTVTPAITFVISKFFVFQVKGL